MHKKTGSLVREFFDSINLRGVSGILLDLDNTLYPYHVNNKRAMARCIEICREEYGISLDKFESAYSESRDIVHKMLRGQGASHSRLLYFHKFAEIIYSVSKPSFASRMEDVYWDEFLQGMDYYEGAEDFLIKAVKQGVGICIVTDLTTGIQFRKWEKLGLGRYANYIVSSEEAGIEKPEARIFELALSKLGLKASEVIMIGDSQDKDIKGAERLGIKSYWLDTKAVE